MKRILTIVTCFILLAPVFGQDTVTVFRQEGIASWYGSEFSGKPTASGEIFNPQDLTAAHPKLPFGTILLVTNVHNGKQITVRVNDRGPFAAARIIDLSQGAAEKLDMIVTGTAPVVIETINLVPAAAVPSSAVTVQPQPPAPVQEAPVPPPANQNSPVANASPAPVAAPVPVPAAAAPGAVPMPAAPAPLAVKVNPGIPPAGTGKSYRLQVGSYKIAKNAVEAFERIKNTGLNPAYERYNDLYRVVLAQIKSDDVQSVVDTLGKAGFPEILIREER